MNKEEVLHCFRELWTLTEENWDGQGADKPSEEQQKWASTLVHRLMWRGLYPVGLGPSAGDQVGIFYDFYAGQDMDIFTLPHGRFEYLMVTKMGESWLATEESGDADIEKVIEVVTTMRKEKVE